MDFTVEDLGEINMDERIKLLEKLKIRLQGHIYIGKEKRKGWSAPASVYRFRCPKHGYVKSNVKGYNKRLECPLCFEEINIKENILMDKEKPIARVTS